MSRREEDSVTRVWSAGLVEYAYIMNCLNIYEVAIQEHATSAGLQIGFAERAS